MAHDTEMVARQVNLTFALLGQSDKRDYDWVVANVDGYGHDPEDTSVDAVRTKIRRDIKDLKRLGVPAGYDDGQVWVDKELYELPPIDLTAEEASVIGLAVDFTQGGGLGAFARSGWTKLAAGGATRAFDAPALVSVSNDITELDAGILRDVAACVRGRQRISFDFTRAAGAAPERRVVDPWGVVPLNNRAYLVGFDIDRGEERVFRMKKISDVRKSTVEGPFHDQSRDLQGIIEEQLRGPVTDATVVVSGGAGEELARRGTRDGDTITVQGLERDWVVRTIASLAGNLQSVEPADVRADVVALLHSGAKEA